MLVGGRAVDRVAPTAYTTPSGPRSDEADFRHNEFAEPGCMRSVRLENPAIRRTGPAGEEAWERPLPEMPIVYMWLRAGS